MANFLFYRYHFVNTGEKSLFSADDNEVLSNELLNKRFIDDMVSKGEHTKELNLSGFKYDRKGEQTSEIYANEIKRCDNGIVLLQVRNNKKKRFMPINQTEPQEVGHYPYCWVIVDTRAESQAILVQQKREAFQNPDDVASLVVDYCSSELGLSYLGWEMTSEKRICKGSIWDIVRSRTESDQDRVKSLCIKLDDKRKNAQGEVDKALQFIMDKLAAPEGELKLFTDDVTRKLLDETKKDVRETVDLLIENQYRLKIGFERSGSVEYGRKADAVYGIADSVCEEFENGQPIFGDRGQATFNLVKWLDTIMPEDDGHIYSQSERRTRNGRRSKK